MKALSSAMLALTVAALPIVGMPDTGPKTLKALDGTVRYGSSATPSNKLAKNASTALSDDDYTQTLAKSKATITLPDSSVVLVGENSDVQMQSFDNSSGTNTANFVLVGKVRFQVEHPAGAKASYTFKTPTGQIAVRGTVGDIFATPAQGTTPGALQVNVYALTDPALPVQVTLVNGQVFTLAAGQSLVVTSAAGTLVGSVGAVSNSTFAPFTQLGAPVNATSLGITSTATATAATAAGTTAAATAAAAAAVGGAAIITTTAANSNKNNTQPPATPAPTSTSVPITVNGHPHIQIGRPLTRPTPAVN